MLTGTVPFSGSSPLAIAMKHTSETPRSPRELVSSIPPALEQVVLHTLEKSPEDRPANAAEFREELLATAERLGLEHAAITSSPNMAALRSVGTESPSGRLVIDISRLRENRAAGSEGTELTVVAQSPGVAAGNGPDIPPLQSTASRSFPKLLVPFNGSRKENKQLKVVVAVLAAILLIGATLAVRSLISAPIPQAAATATPSPTVEPSPSPSPTPGPSPNREVRKPAAKPTKESKSSSFVKKVKRIFRNPF